MVKVVIFCDASKMIFFIDESMEGSMIRIVGLSFGVRWLSLLMCFLWFG